MSILDLALKGSRFSPTLHLQFRIERQDDDEWPWVATLEGPVSPRGTGLVPDSVIPPGTTVDCGHCSADTAQAGRRICDACAVEEWIASVGAEDWLERAHIKVGDREGLLKVHGCVEWPITEDGEGRFWPSYLCWNDSPLHCLLEPEEDGDQHWEPGWYFYDETYPSRHGPFDSYTEASEASVKYAEGL